MGAGTHCSAAAASRILGNWELREQVEAVATCPDLTVTRHYDNNELLGLILVNVKGSSRRIRGGPHWLVHRVDYQKILAEAAVANTVKIDFAQTVTAVDIEYVTLTLDTRRALEQI